jgi:cytochrome b
VHALKPDTTFMDADAFAQLLAKMKYFIKSIAMVEAHRHQAHHPGGIIG